MRSSFRTASAFEGLDTLGIEDLRDGTEGKCDVIESGSQRLPLPGVSVRDTSRMLAEYRPVDARQAPIQRPVGMPPTLPGYSATVGFPSFGIAQLWGPDCVNGGVILHGDHILEGSFSARWEACGAKGRVAGAAHLRVSACEPDVFPGRG